MRGKAVMLLVCASVWTAAPLFAGSVYYASPTGTSSGTGSAEDPYDIVTACSKLGDWQGDEVRLLSGTYKVGSVTLDAIDCGAKLTGADGTATDAVLDFEGASKGVSVSNGGIVENLTISNSVGSAAALYLHSGSNGATASNCVVCCSSFSSGYAVQVGGSYPVLVVDCVIRDITGAATYGCAVYCSNPKLHLLKTTIANNSSSSWSGAAALYSNVSGVLVEGCVISNNVVTSSRPGGAIYTESVGIRVKDTLFYGNSTGNEGGAFYAYSSASNTNVIEGCTFIANKGTHGGAIGANQYNTIVSNCTFIANVANGSYGRGGAIRGYVNSTSGAASRLKVFGCAFTNNVAKSGGSAISVGRRGTDRVRPAFEVTKCHFKGNTNSANAVGGSIQIYGFGLVEATDCDFEDNFAGTNDGCGGEGGAIGRTNDDWNEAMAHAICRRCTFTNNRAGSGAALAVNAACYDCDFTENVGSSMGVIYNHGYRKSGKETDDGTLTNEFVNCHFKDNRTGSYPGIYMPYRSHFLMRDTTFTNGVATGYGWVTYLEKPTYFEVDRCQVVGTRAGGTGSGILIMQGAELDSLTNGFVRNSLLFNNTSVTSGGANWAVLHVRWTNTWISCCTVVSNYITGGIWSGIHSVSTQPDCVSDCIMYLNDCSNGTQYRDCNYSSTKFKNCYVSKNTTLYNGCIGGPTLDPKFVDWTAGDLRLRKDSPCIDAGVAEPWMAGATDIRGKRKFKRIQGVAPDIGCYEYRPPSGAVLFLR